MKVTITIDDDNGRKAKLEIDESDKLTSLVIIQNVFNLFGIKTDILEMTKMFNKIGKAYSQFFSEVNPIEPNTTINEKIDKEKVKEQLIEGFTKDKDAIKATYQEVDDQPEF